MNLATKGEVNANNHYSEAKRDATSGAKGRALRLAWMRRGWLAQRVRWGAESDEERVSSGCMDGAAWIWTSGVQWGGRVLRCGALRGGRERRSTDLRGAHGQLRNGSGEWVRAGSADWARGKSDEFYASERRRDSFLGGSFVWDGGIGSGFRLLLSAGDGSDDIEFGIKLCVFVAYGVGWRVGRVLAGRETVVGA